MIEFAAAFATGGYGVMQSGWIKRGGQYVTYLYDWCDCWFTGPLPVLAEVVAPSGVSTAGQLSSNTYRLSSHELAGFGHDILETVKMDIALTSLVLAVGLVPDTSGSVAGKKSVSDIGGFTQKQAMALPRSGEGFCRA